MGHLGADITALVGLLEVGSRLGNTALVALGNNALCLDRHGREEVGNVGALGADEAKLLKVGPGVGARTVVCDTTVSEDKDLVELVKDAVSGLIRGQDNRLALVVGVAAQGAGELESRLGVKTTRRLVPQLDGALASHDLGERDSLALTTRHAAHELVAHARLAGVVDA